MKNVVCSHGFGVRADDRGLFTDLAAAMPAFNFITFDYNDIDSAGNMTVPSLIKQAEMLEDRLRRTEDAKVLLCHSQGCIIASLAHLPNVERIIFLAPPGEKSIERFMSRMLARTGTVYNPNGLSSIPRQDGTITYVGIEYIQSIKSIDIKERYTAIARNHNLTILKALKDEVIGETDFSYLSVPIRTLNGGHNFLPPHRAELIKVLEGIL